MQHVEQLPLVFVDAFDLAVEDGVRIDGTRLPTGARRRIATLASRLARRKAVDERGSLGQRHELLELGQVGDPAVADGIGDQAGKVGVGQQKPAPGGDAVGLVVEPLGEHIREIGDDGCPQQPEWISATPLVLCVPTIARLAMRTRFSGPSAIRLTRANRASSPGKGRELRSRNAD